jgi:hypothetical protein
LLHIFMIKTSINEEIIFITEIKSWLIHQRCILTLQDDIQKLGSSIIIF